MNTSPIVCAAPTAEFLIGGLCVRYPYDVVSGTVGCELLPSTSRAAALPRRQWLAEREILALPAPWNRAPAAPADSLVHLSCAGDERAPGYAQGRTLRGGGTMGGLRFQRQEVVEHDGATTICTHLTQRNGLHITHRLTASLARPVATVQVVATNAGSAPVTLEMLTSFCLGGITPFHAQHAPERLQVHRLRTSWSAEARLTSDSIEHLHLERSWQPHSVASERFGQVGSLPCRGFFPLAAVEDQTAGVTWAAQLACGGSWQMEFYRRGDALSFSGGLADREFGQWALTLMPGEALTCPTAFVTVVAGGPEEAFEQLVRQQRATLAVVATERDLPVVCNEFCATWGNPTVERIMSLAERLVGSGVRYLVIDAGWYAGPECSWFDAHGDWQASSTRFPTGLAAAGQAIRKAGLIPGIWFEPETVGADSAAYHQTGLLLHRDGVPLTVARRRFWDLRRAEVRALVLTRLLAVLDAGGFGYLKIDYNETVGVGPDGAASPGEELRQLIAGVHQLLDALRHARPELVLETCASGGHRLEPSFLARSAMASSSDAHETAEAPIVAAALHRCVHPAQSQVWAVIRPEDPPGRQLFALASGFLGRMCLSGALDQLEPAAWQRVQAAITLYRRCAPLIDAGSSRCFGTLGTSWRAPCGWQALRRVADDDSAVLVVVHGFTGSPPSGWIAEVPLPPGAWHQAGSLVEGAGVELHPDRLQIHLPSDLSAAVILLTRMPS